MSNRDWTELFLTGWGRLFEGEKWIWKHNWKDSWALLLLQWVFSCSPTSPMKPSLYPGAAVEVIVSVKTGIACSQLSSRSATVGSHALHICLQTSHCPAHRPSRQHVLVTHLPLLWKSVFSLRGQIYMIYYYYFSFQKAVFKSLKSGTVLEINGLRVKLVIPSTSHCLSMREGPRGCNFVQWKKIFVPCLFYCWALGSGEGSLQVF